MDVGGVARGGVSLGWRRRGRHRARRGHRRHRLRGGACGLAQHVDLAAGLTVGDRTGLRVAEPGWIDAGLGWRGLSGQIGACVGWVAEAGWLVCLRTWCRGCCVGWVAQPDVGVGRQWRGGVGRLAECDRLVGGQTGVAGGHRMSGLAEAGGLADGRTRVVRRVGGLADRDRLFGRQGGHSRRHARDRLGGLLAQSGRRSRGQQSLGRRLASWLDRHGRLDRRHRRLA